MPVTRFAEDPLLSEDETLRRAALFHLGQSPTSESVKAILRALLHFMQESATLAEPFVTALTTSPMARAAEEPILELLDHAEESVREQAAFMLYRIRIRESSRKRMLQVLKDDQSHWARAYAAKALAMLGGNEVGGVLVEAIDNEATPEAVSRLAEAIALLGRPGFGEALVEQAEQLRERGAHAGADADRGAELQACALFVEALAVRLGAAVEGGALEGVPEQVQIYRAAERGTVELTGGIEQLGFAARVRLSSGREVVLPQDSPNALRLLG